MTKGIASAFVGGGSSGIGRAIALRLARDGNAVAIAGRRKAELAAAAADIELSTGFPVVPVVADLAVAADIDAALRDTEAALGPIDVLVANTGGPPAGRFSDIDDDGWQHATDLLLMSFVRMARGVLPGMAERGHGRVILVTSTAVRQPIDDLLLSVVLRSAATALAKMLARQYGPYGITVNCLAPGVTNTNRRRDASAARAERAGVPIEQVLSEDERLVPAGRAAEPEEIAHAASFLASRAAAYVNGTTLTVDGGRTETIW